MTCACLELKCFMNEKETEKLFLKYLISPEEKMLFGIQRVERIDAQSGEKTAPGCF